MLTTEKEVLTVNHFINGQYRQSATKKTFEVHDPSTQRLIAIVSEASEEDVNEAANSARQAFEHSEWRTMPLAERCGKIRRMADIIIERKEEIARLEAMDVGKPYQHAVGSDIPRAAHNLRFFADFVEKQGDEAYPMDENFLNYTRYEPVGVAGLITPWNAPFMLTTWKLGPCLAAGNTAVIKPAELTPLSISLLGEIAQQAGIPDGVVNVIHGSGKTVGTWVTEQPEIDLISFTGSTVTGKQIIKNGANTLKKTSFELGGKAANIIFEDADLSKAVPTSIQAAFLNSGQVCLAGSRILVQRTILDEFLEKFKAAAEALVVGDPQDPKTTTGPLVSKVQYDKVNYYIELAKEEGAKLITGDQPLQLSDDLAKGYYIAPTIFLHHDPNARTCQEEIFGPVVTVLPFDTEDEALAIANNTDYGLNGVIWTENLKRAHRVSHAVRAGTIWVNCWFVRDLRVPFGGFKKSGVGREGGRHSMEFFTEAKNICISLN